MKSLLPLLLALTGFAASPESALKFADPKPQAYSLTLRASEIDPRCKSHPEVGFVLEAAFKPADHAFDHRLAILGTHLGGIGHIASCGPFDLRRLIANACGIGDLLQVLGYFRNPRGCVGAFVQ